MEIIDFCDSKAILLTDPVKKKNLFKELRVRWNNYEYNTFPGSQPVSIERVHLEKISKNPYWVCEKSDGMRFLFVCTRYENVPYCFLVDRKQDMYMLNFEMISNAFDGTILDGELVKNNTTNRYEYLVYDSTIVFGESTTTLSHSERMKCAIDVVYNIKYDNSNTPFQVRLKEFYPLAEFESYVRDIVPTIGHAIDGYIFTPENETVKSGTHFTMYKWKELKKNTVDFLVEKNRYKPREYIIKIAKGRTLKTLFGNTIQVIPGSETERLICKGESTVVECEYVSPNCWLALFVRTDKTRPNSYLTWTKTLLNIEEDIQLKEFFLIKG